MKYHGDVDLSEKEMELRELLLKLESSESAQKNKQLVLEFSKDLDKGSQEFLKCIVNKKPKIGVGQRLILKTFPGLFTPFAPQKGHLYKPEKKYTAPFWYATPKWNGIRAVCLYTEGEWVLRTYVGHKIHTCNHIIAELETLRELFGYTMVDGELYNHDLTFNQIESAVLTASNAEAGKQANIVLHAFTAGQEKYFSAQECKGFVPQLPEFDGEYVQCVVAIPLETPEEIELFYRECIKREYEGVVLRNPNKPYDFTKSLAMLKVKRDCFGDLDISDCKVVEIIHGEIPIANSTGGYDYVPAMAALRVIQPDGLDCKVGGGFSQAFRLQVLSGDIPVIGHVIEVKHEGWGDKGRMIFPRFERLRHIKDKNEAA